MVKYKVSKNLGCGMLLKQNHHICIRTFAQLISFVYCHMPSKSFNSFKYNLIDVDRLREAHTALHNGEQGRKGLGHITRSGVVMLCASWEHYCENLLRESAKYLSEKLNGALDLPKEVQKEISKAVRESNHELKPLHLCGDGWKQVYQDHANVLLNALHTPKSGKLNDHFKRLLGIEKLSSAWALGENTLDDFVSVRGGIAHVGRHADYVTINNLNTYRDQIYQYAVETDNSISAYLKVATKMTGKPWNKTT